MGFKPPQKEYLRVSYYYHISKEIFEPKSMYVQSKHVPFFPPFPQIASLASHMMLAICLSFLQVDCTHGTNKTKGWWTTTLKLSLVPQQASSILFSHLLQVDSPSDHHNPQKLFFIIKTPQKMYKVIRKKKREAFNDVKLAQTRCQPC